MMKRIFAAALFGVAFLAPAGVSAQTQPAAPASSSMLAIRLISVRISTPDLARSERFYREVFGLVQTGTYPEYERVLNLPGERAPRIILFRSNEAQPNGSFAIAVTDIDAVMSRAAANGGTITRPASAESPQMPGVRIGFFTDPDGTVIEAIQVPPRQ